MFIGVKKGGWPRQHKKVLSAKHEKEQIEQGTTRTLCIGNNSTMRRRNSRKLIGVEVGNAKILDAFVD